MCSEFDFSAWPLLSRDFFLPSASEVAPKLLGHALVLQNLGGVVGGIIVETEAYLSNDPASHSYRGKTARNASMFGPCGHSYVYFVYGCHFCVNTVCHAEGVGEAVLIRALEISHSDPRTASGPGKICKWLSINRKHDALDLCSAQSSLQIRQNPLLGDFLADRGGIVATSRIGITKAAVEPLRYVLPGSQALSRKLVPLRD